MKNLPSRRKESNRRREGGGRGRLADFQGKEFFSLVLSRRPGKLDLDTGYVQSDIGVSLFCLEKAFPGEQGNRF